MKRFIAYIFAVATLVSCSVDSTNFVVSDNVILPGQIIDPNSNGYLDFGDALTIAVEAEKEEFNDEESGDYTEATRTDATRTEAPDNYIVVVTNDKTSEVVYNESYKVVKSLTEPLVLPAGVYTIQARSKEQYPSPVWDAPEYASEPLTVVVADEKVVEVEELICKLATIKTQVAVSADMLELFDTSNSAATPFVITLSYANEQLEFSNDETRSGFFAPQSSVTTMDVELVGMYNVAEDGAPASYIPITWKQTLTGVMGGQSRYVTIKIDNYNSGKVQFKFEVQTWVYDAPLGVDIMSGLFYAVNSGEDTIYDPDSETTDIGAPILTLANGLVVEDTYVVSQLMMDMVNSTYDPIYSVVLTPQLGAKVAKVELVTRSTNNSLLDDVEALKNYLNITPTWSATSGFDNLFNGYFNSSYDSAIGALTATLRYEAIEFINSYKGSHEVVVCATDDAGRVSNTSLYFISIIAGGPEVTWRGGYSFDDEHIIDADTALPVIIDIESMTGISKMELSINSSVLTPE